MRRLAPLALALLAIVLAAGPASAATTWTVRVGDDYFDPAVRSIARGDSVKWKNIGNRTHTVTLNNGFTFFSSETLAPNGGVFTKAFPGAGTFGYHCAIHSGQSGKVKVPIGLAKVDGKIRVTVASAPVSGFRHRIEKKRNSGAWSLLGTTSSTSLDFAPSRTGTWTFRARMENINNGSHSGWAKKSISW